MSATAAAKDIRRAARRRASPGRESAQKTAELAYKPTEGVSAFVKKYRRATPMQLIETERKGVNARLLKDLAREMNVPASRFFNMIGIPKATAEKKATGLEAIDGASGQAALGVVRLLSIALNMIDNSTAKEAASFNVTEWLGRWLEHPQPALGGRKPAEFLDTPTGIEAVARVLGAIESGAYL